MISERWHITCPFSYQKWHWTKWVELVFGRPFWPSWLSDWSCTVLNEFWNWSPVGWWIGGKTKLYATRSFRPMWLRQMFFCLKGITNGIAHPPSKKAKVTVEHKCGTRMTTNKCADVRVDLGLGCTYCRMCYRKLLGTTASEQKSVVRKTMCRMSRMGCPICKEPICNECWGEGYDKHAQLHI